jgi:hypothetical protein
MHPLRFGYAALEYEIAEERVSALARLGQRLEAACRSAGAIVLRPAFRGGSPLSCACSDCALIESLVIEIRQECRVHDFELRLAPIFQ